MHRSAPGSSRPLATIAFLLLVGVAPYATGAPPARPGGFEHAVYSNSAAELFWQRSAGSVPAVGYELERNGVDLGVFETLSYFDDTLEPGIEYTYIIRGVSADGERSASSTLALRTPPSADTIATLLRTIEELEQRLEVVAPAPVPETGQRTSLLPGDDGDWQAGVRPSRLRFNLNVNPSEDLNGDGECDANEVCDGTVTDRLTGLIWLRDAGCLGTSDWYEALQRANQLADDASGTCDLSDSSRPGDWRLPNVRELVSIVDFSRLPTFPVEHPFANVQAFGDDGGPTRYWTSTSRTDFDGTYGSYGDSGYAISLAVAWIESWYAEAHFYVWAVR